jgi:hypothetical protein
MQKLQPNNIHKNEFTMQSKIIFDNNGNKIIIIIEIDKIKKRFN